MTAIGMHVGRYELLRLLSAGGMGEVYLARQTSSVEGFATLAAVKVLLQNLSSNAAFVQMFLDEARIVGRLHHKNIVQIRDIAEHDGQYYMAMEYIPGQTLRELLGDASIRDRPLFEPRLGCEIFADLGGALGAAHAAGLVHRDISPNNIMISDDGVPKLIDFGVARAMGSASLTNPGTLKGKFGYMAPEYVRGESYDARVDVFSLGVVMWETFARRRLFRGTSAAEQLHQLLESEIPRLDAVNPAIPADVATLVEGALERDPQRRISSALMLSDALLAIAQDLPQGADRSLQRWLEQRIAGRMEERNRTDQVLMSLPAGSPIPDFGPAVQADAVSIPGTYGFTREGSGRHGSGSRSGHSPHKSATSIRMAAGQVDEAPPPVAPVAPRSNRALMIGVMSAAVVVVLAVLLFRGGRGDTISRAPATAVAVTDDAATGSAMSLAEAHRQIGLKAMADGDYGRARSEYAEALRAGGTGDLVQLMELATQLEAEERAKSTGVVATAATAPAVEVPAARTPVPAKATARATAKASPPSKDKPPQRSRAAVVPAVRDETARAEPVPAAPPAPSVGDLVVTSVTPRAVVQVDGATVGQTQLRVKVKPGEHRLVVRHGDQQLDARRITIVAGETTRVHIETQPNPVTASVPAPTVSPPAPKPSVVAPPAPVARPRTPRVTSSGDPAAGAGVVAACNRCHQQADARSVSSRRYTRAQWDRFFATGQHDRYVPIGDQMTAGQLAAARAFLRLNAADAPENQGAGVRE